MSQSKFSTDPMDLRNIINGLNIGSCALPEEADLVIFIPSSGNAFLPNLIAKSHKEGTYITGGTDSVSLNDASEASDVLASRIGPEAEMLQKYIDAIVAENEADIDESFAPITGLTNEMFVLRAKINQACSNEQSFASDFDMPMFVAINTIENDYVTQVKANSAHHNTQRALISTLVSAFKEQPQNIIAASELGLTCESFRIASGMYYWYENEQNQATAEAEETEAVAPKDPWTGGGSDQIGDPGFALTRIELDDLDDNSDGSEHPATKYALITDSDDTDLRSVFLVPTALIMIGDDDEKRIYYSRSLSDAILDSTSSDAGLQITGSKDPLVYTYQEKMKVIGDVTNEDMNQIAYSTASTAFAIPDPYDDIMLLNKHSLQAQSILGLDSFVPIDRYIKRTQVTDTYSLYPVTVTAPPGGVGDFTYTIAIPGEDLTSVIKFGMKISCTGIPSTTTVTAVYYEESESTTYVGISSDFSGAASITVPVAFGTGESFITVDKEKIVTDYNSSDIVDEMFVVPLSGYIQEGTYVSDVSESNAGFEQAPWIVYSTTLTQPTIGESTSESPQTLTFMNKCDISFHYIEESPIRIAGLRPPIFTAGEYYEIGSTKVLPFSSWYLRPFITGSATSSAGTFQVQKLTGDASDCIVVTATGDSSIDAITTSIIKTIDGVEYPDNTIIQSIHGLINYDNLSRFRNGEELWALTDIKKVGPVLGDTEGLNGLTAQVKVPAIDGNVSVVLTGDEGSSTATLMFSGNPSSDAIDILMTAVYNGIIYIQIGDSAVQVTSLSTIDGEPANGSSIYDCIISGVLPAGCNDMVVGLKKYKEITVYMGAHGTEQWFLYDQTEEGITLEPGVHEIELDNTFVQIISSAVYYNNKNEGNIHLCAVAETSMAVIDTTPSVYTVVIADGGFSEGTLRPTTATELEALLPGQDIDMNHWYGLWTLLNCYREYTTGLMSLNSVMKFTATNNFDEVVTDSETTPRCYGRMSTYHSEIPYRAISPSVVKYDGVAAIENMLGKEGDGTSLFATTIINPISGYTSYEDDPFAQIYNTPPAEDISVGSLDNWSTGIHYSAIVPLAITQPHEDATDTTATTNMLKKFTGTQPPSIPPGSEYNNMKHLVTASVDESTGEIANLFDAMFPSNNSRVIADIDALGSALVSMGVPAFLRRVLEKGIMTESYTPVRCSYTLGVPRPTESAINGVLLKIEDALSGLSTYVGNVRSIKLGTAGTSTMKAAENYRNDCLSGTNGVPALLLVLQQEILPQLTDSGTMRLIIQNEDNEFHRYDFDKQYIYEGLWFHAIRRGYFLLISLINSVMALFLRLLGYAYSYGKNNQLTSRPQSDAKECILKLHSFLQDDGSPLYPIVEDGSIASDEIQMPKLNIISNLVPDNKLYYDLSLQIKHNDGNEVELLPVLLPGMGAPAAVDAVDADLYDADQYFVRNSYKPEFIVVDPSIESGIQYLQDVIGRSDYQADVDGTFKYWINQEMKTIGKDRFLERVQSSMSRGISGILPTRITGKINSSRVHTYLSASTLNLNPKIRANVEYKRFEPRDLSIELNESNTMDAYGINIADGEKRYTLDDRIDKYAMDPDKFKADVHSIAQQVILFIRLNADNIFSGTLPLNIPFIGYDDPTLRGDIYLQNIVEENGADSTYVQRFDHNGRSIFMLYLLQILGFSIYNPFTTSATAEGSPIDIVSDSSEITSLISAIPANNLWIKHHVASAPDLKGTSDSDAAHKNKVDALAFINDGLYLTKRRGYFLALCVVSEMAKLSQNGLNALDGSNRKVCITFGTGSPEDIPADGPSKVTNTSMFKAFGTDCLFSVADFNNSLSSLTVPSVHDTETSVSINHENASITAYKGTRGSVIECKGLAGDQTGVNLDYILNGTSRISGFIPIDAGCTAVRISAVSPYIPTVKKDDDGEYHISMHPDVARNELRIPWGTGVKTFRYIAQDYKWDRYYLDMMRSCRFFLNNALESGTSGTHYDSVIGMVKGVSDSAAVTEAGMKSVAEREKTLKNDEGLVLPETSSSQVINGKYDSVLSYTQMIDHYKTGGSANQRVYPVDGSLAITDDTVELPADSLSIRHRIIGAAVQGGVNRFVALKGTIEDYITANPSILKCEVQSGTGFTDQLTSAAIVVYTPET